MHICLFFNNIIQLPRVAEDEVFDIFIYRHMRYKGIFTSDFEKKIHAFRLILTDFMKRGCAIFSL